MEYVSHTAAIGGLILQVIADDDRESPRDWSTNATMVCDHRRYNLGDDDGHATARDAIRSSRDYSEAWEDCEKDGLDFSEGPDLYKAIQRCTDILSLPLYLYDHSGITMSTGRFSCPWDSGQVGFIFMTKAKILEAFMAKGTRLTPALKAKAYGYMESDVTVYDQYLTGDVWGYTIEAANGDDLPDDCDTSLWSLYGLNYAIKEGMEAAAAIIAKHPEYAEAHEEEEDA